MSLLSLKSTTLDFLLLSILSYIGLQREKKFCKRIQKITGYKPENIRLYKLALTHKTTATKIHHGDIREDNERLEFLGDAVLDLITAEILFKQFPFKNEGFLTEMRSKMVSREQLGNIAGKIGLLEIVKFDKSMLNRKGAMHVVGGNALEALIGAVYLDKGYKKTSKFIKKRIVDTHLDFKILEESEISYKGKLYEYAQKEKKEVRLDVVNEFRKGGDTYFEICVLIDNVQIAKEVYNSKKKAEELASEKAYKKIMEQSAH
ncbi:MAG: ribonuclease III [Bacteroidia bacterium]|nr:ribonuclease III [Bacteroidia bacterium]MCO5253481.1 ribonuclease III [Bacteroidota bacterium]MCZ2131314.1 ribonuclease III [Bacteroidia bacterium]